MANFDKKLRQSPNYVPHVLLLRIVEREIAGQHPLATIDPAFWTFDADRVLRVFQLLGIVARKEQ